MLADVASVSARTDGRKLELNEIVHTEMLHA